MTAVYKPTEEQTALIEHTGSAFVTACPGAGKTRTMVERARNALDNSKDGRSLAFLSFTHAAVDEIESRLRNLSVLPVPLFPNYIGTFDSFLWQFFIVPFGVPNCTERPILVPDKSNWTVKPFTTAQELELRCFDRETGKADPKLLKEVRFDTRTRSIAPYETRALAMINDAKRNGRIDFEDLREIAHFRLANSELSKRLGQALSGRFSEIIVDEAQDCNPSDLAIVDWMKKSGIAVKLICDPNQAIYQFRGGVTEELSDFSKNFDSESCLIMSGNFRSSPAICKAVVQLRPPSQRSNPDSPLGQNKDERAPVYILSYNGNGVSKKIGPTFQKLVMKLGISINSAPVVASTKASACKAIGQPVPKPTKNLTLLLAKASMEYQFAFARGNRRDALTNLHRIVLLVRQRINSIGEYHTYIANEGINDSDWRPEIISLANILQYKSSEGADEWLRRAHDCLGEGLVGKTIKQRLKKDAALTSALIAPPENSVPARTIHSVKGLEYPAVCVVMTKTAKGIIDLLEGKDSLTSAEEARKIYVPKPKKM